MCMWCHYFNVVIEPWATQEHLDTGGGCGGGEGLKIWMDDKWSGTSDKLRVPMSPGRDVMETGGMWGGGGSCWFDTEMTAYSSRERKHLKVWQQWYDWLKEVVARCDWFLWKSDHPQSAEWVESATEEMRERIYSMKTFFLIELTMFAFCPVLNCMCDVFTSLSLL